MSVHEFLQKMPPELFLRKADIRYRRLRKVQKEDLVLAALPLAHGATQSSHVTSSHVLHAGWQWGPSAADSLLPSALSPELSCDSKY